MPDEKVGSKRLILIIALLIVALPCVVSSAKQAGQSGDKKPTMSPESRERIRQVIASVGIIWVRDPADPSTPNPWRRGSGVVIRNDGVVVTNYHVIIQDKPERLYEDIRFSLPGKATVDAAMLKPYRLRIALIDKGSDLALLRIVADNEGKPLPESVRFPSIEMGDSRAVRELDDLFIIGFPEKGGSTVTINPGLVEGKDILGNWIKTDARLIHGNSGGAAVNSEGKLIGIPTKIVSDQKRIDTDGDGFPDETRSFGEIGFLRPSLLVALMLAQLDDPQLASGRADIRSNVSPPTQSKRNNGSTQPGPQFVPPATAVVVRGIIKSASDASPIAGARVGLVPIGSEDVTVKNLLTWGSTNSDGKFELNNPVPPGRYMLRARSLRHEVFTREVEIVRGGSHIVIEMRLLQGNQ